MQPRFCVQPGRERISFEPALEAAIKELVALFPELGAEIFVIGQDGRSLFGQDGAAAVGPPVVLSRRGKPSACSLSRRIRQALE